MSSVVAFPRTHAAPGGQVRIFPRQDGHPGWALVQVKRNNICVPLRNFRDREDAETAGPGWAAQLGAIFDASEADDVGGAA